MVKICVFIAIRGGVELAGNVVVLVLTLLLLLQRRMVLHECSFELFVKNQTCFTIQQTQDSYVQSIRCE